MGALNEPKPFASLGPTLLARKGGARPAMRPQVTPLSALSPQPLSASEEDEHDFDDLGWNDMGEDHAEPHHDEPFEATVHPLPTLTAPIVASEPEVRRQQRAIVQSIAADDLDIAPTRAASRAVGKGRRAAFTLRLDAERHLKLRLASTLRNRSSQQLVTEALDRFLAEIPEIDALALQLQPE